MYRVEFDEANKLWKSHGPPQVYDPSVSLGNVLLRSMELQGSKIAQICDDSGEQCTFEELRMKTIRAAQNLQKRGYKSKQVFGFMTGNFPDVAPIAFASLCMGCPINAQSSTWKPDMLRMLGITEPDLIFCEVEVYDVMVECLTELGNKAKIFTFNGTKGDSEPVQNLFEETGIEDEFIPVEVDGYNDIAAILSTSGSTGPSKGFCLSHAAFFSEADAGHVKMYANGIAYSPCELSWIVGLNTLFIATIAGATRILSTQRFSLELEVSLIKKYKVTVVDTVPYDPLQMLKEKLVTKEDLASLKHMIVGGYKVPQSILDEFNSLMPNGMVHNIYGLTEIGTVSMDYPKYSGKDSAGRVIYGVTVKIVDEQGNKVGLNVDGEICVKSRNKYLGYHKNKQLSDESIDSEGFFLTGDIGHIDEDGHLYIVDRKKDMIQHIDGWIYPSEIEDALMKCPGIQSACVVAVPYDESFEVPAAIVVRAEGSQVTQEDIDKYIEANCANDCQLEGGIYFFDSMPMSNTGKPFKKQLKATVTKLYEEKKEKEKENEESPDSEDESNDVDNTKL